MKLDEAKIYLQRMENSRAKDEQHNKAAYEQAREISALVSLAEFGNDNAKKQAIKTLGKF
jgi:hypothetical protein